MYAELVRKTCTKCLIDQPIVEFYKNKRYVDGHVTWCKTCKKEHARANPEINKDWISRNPAKVIKTKAKYAQNNPEKRKVSRKKWYDANPKKVLAAVRRYQAAKLNATPPWLTKEQLKEMSDMYINCPKGYHVDHITPLQSRTVRGLHVPWNLQYLLAGPNQRKSNKY